MQVKAMPGLVELSAGPWTAEVFPAFGMNTIALSFYGRPILRTPFSWRELEDAPYAYGAPILLPPNRTDGGCFTFDGECYQLPLNDKERESNLHGVLYQRPFAVLERTERSILAAYENTGDDYPFPFFMEVRCTLGRSGYQQKFVIKNTGTGDMPLTFGLHTTFLEQAMFRVDIGARWILDERLLPTGDLEPLQGEEASYPRGARFQGQKIHGFYTAAGHTAQIGDILYTVSENFDHWVLWNGNGDEGFCTIEPLQGGINALNSGKGLIRLKPGERTVFEADFRHVGSAKSGAPCMLYIPDGQGRGVSKTLPAVKQYRRCPPPDRCWPHL